MRRYIPNWMDKAFMRFARMKARAARVGFYIAYFNTLLLVSLKGWRWWYVLVGVSVVLLYLYESIYGIKGEADVANAQSEHAIDTTERLKRIEQLLLEGKQ